MGRRGRHTEPSSRLADGQPSDGREEFVGRVALRPSELPTLRLGPSKSRDHTLDYATAFELRNRREDMQLEPPRRRGGVDALPERHERNPKGLQLVQQENQVSWFSTCWSIVLTRA